MESVVKSWLNRPAWGIAHGPRKKGHGPDPRHSSCQYRQRFRALSMGICPGKRRLGSAGLPDGKLVLREELHSLAPRGAFPFEAISESCDACAKQCRTVSFHRRLYPSMGMPRGQIRPSGPTVRSRSPESVTTCVPCPSRDQLWGYSRGSGDWHPHR